MPGFWFAHILVLIEVLGAISLLWAVVDARPAVAMAVFALAYLLRPGIAYWVAGPIFPAAALSLIVGALAPVLVWRLHRQSAGATAHRLG